MHVWIPPLPVFLQEAFGFFFFAVYTSFFEWVFHRYVLHQRLIWHRPFNAHTLIHHKVFGSGETYHLNRRGGDHKVALAWWTAPALVSLHLPLFWGVEVLTGFDVFWGGIVAMAVYYSFYEYLHWCMHVPKMRRFELTRPYLWLKEHHRLHHKHYFKNLNTVFPLADLVLGTRISKDIPARRAD